MAGGGAWDDDLPDVGHDDRFEWDEFNLESAQRHGVTWREIETSFDEEPYVDRFG